MKTKALSVLAGVGGAMLISSGVDASYQGLSVALHTQAMVPQGGGAPALRNVYRVYAVFSDPGDFITSVAGSPTLGNMVIQTLNSSGVAPGGTFINPAGGGATAPTYYANVPPFQWDTFVDIGLASVPYGGLDETGLSPGFAGIPNTGVNTDNAGWFTAGPVAQGMAGNGTNLGNGTWGVLIMQLTVNAGNHVAGTVAIGGVNNNPLAGGTTFQTNADQTFNSFPAPGALALLGLAGLVGSRRRRG
jgi:hypothetical protein